MATCSKQPRAVQPVVSRQQLSVAPRQQLSMAPRQQLPSAKPAAGKRAPRQQLLLGGGAKRQRYAPRPNPDKGACIHGCGTMITPFPQYVSSHNKRCTVLHPPKSKGPGGRKHNKGPTQRRPYTLAAKLRCMEKIDLYRGLAPKAPGA